MDESIIQLDVAYRAIQEASSIQEIKVNMDVLLAAELYAKRQNKGEEIKIQIADYILTAKTKLGEMLKAAKEAGQITHEHGNQYMRDVPSENNPKTTLAEAGISRKLSSESQQIANIPKKKREELVAKAKATGKSENLSPKAILRASKDGERPSLRPHPKTAEIIAMMDAGVSLDKITVAVGLNRRSVDNIVAKEKARREGEKIARGQIDPEILSLPMREKARRYIEQELYRAKLDMQANFSVMAKAHFAGYLATLEKREAEANKILQCRIKLGFMDVATFKLIRNCLHSDRIMDPELKTDYDRAFIAFCELEKYVLNEKESPTIKLPKPPPLPSDIDELMEARAKATEMRRIKREQRKAGITVHRG